MSRARAIIEVISPRDLLKKLPRFPDAWRKFKRWSWRDKERGILWHRAENNTYWLHDTNDHSWELVFHNTSILKKDAQHNVTVSCGGYYTRTTLDRLNTYLPHGWRIQGGTVSGWTGWGTPNVGWYWYNVEWPEEIRWAVYREIRRVERNRRWFAVPFTDGDTINNNSGVLHFGGGKAWPDGAIQYGNNPVISRERAVTFYHQTQGRRRRRGWNDPDQLQFQLEHLVLMGLLNESYLDRLHRIKRIQAKHDRMAEIERLKKEIDPAAIRKAKPSKFAPERR